MHRFERVINPIQKLPRFIKNKLRMTSTQTQITNLLGNTSS